MVDLLAGIDGDGIHSLVLIEWVRPLHLRLQPLLHIVCAGVFTVKKGSEGAPLVQSFTDCR